MEQWQRENIRRHLPELIKRTNVNVQLLAELQSQNILSEEETESLGIKRSYEAASRLYTILMTRFNSYSILLQALNNGRQSGAYKILSTESYEKLFKLVKNQIPHFQFEEYESLLKTIASQENLDEILKHGEFRIAKDTIPPPCEYYIPRQVSNRATVNPELFKKQTADVFVFKGITRSELSKFAESMETSSSSLLLSKSACKFVLLDVEHDWFRLKSLSANPIHLINVETSVNKGETEYVLEDTSGRSTEVWRYLKRESGGENCYISELDFVEKLIQDKNPLKVACICDKPGSGKSLLLGSLARQLQIQKPNETVVLLSLSSFATDYLASVLNISVSTSVVIDLLSTYISSSDFSREIIKRALEKRWMTISVFCDGFDEIRPDLLKVSNDFLATLAKCDFIQNIVVSCRTHLQSDLEKTLCVVAYHVLPFDESTQVELLTNSFRMMYPGGDLARLKSFAIKTLQRIRKLLSENDTSMFGNPLFTKMIADVMYEDAKIYAQNVEYKSEMLHFGSIQNIEDVFSHFVNKQFGCNTKEARNIKSLHVWKAFATLFPQISNQVKMLLGTVPETTLLELMNYGLLEITESDANVETKFVHLTFAEFLIAEFTGECLLSKDTNQFNYKFAEEFFTSILLETVETNTLRLRVLKDFQYCKLHNFSYPVILKFLNFYFQKKQLETLGLYGVDKLEPVKLTYILQACILQDYPSIFRILQLSATKTTHNKYENISLPVFSSNFKLSSSTLSVGICHFLIQTAAEFSDRQMLHECIQLLCDKFGFNKTTIFKSISQHEWTPLSAAITRPNYELTEYLTHKLPLENREYLHLCIKNSCKVQLDILKTKRKICDMLIGKNYNLLSELSLRYCHPILLESNVHLSLLKFLVAQGANLRAMSNYYTCVHTASWYMSSEDFHEFCRFLIDCEASDIFKVNIDNMYNTVFYIVRYYEKLLAKTIDIILKSCYINVNRIILNANKFKKSSSASTLVQAALQGNQSLEVIQTLKKHGADVHFKNANEQNALHFAVGSSKINRVAYLVSLGISAVDKDAQGNDCLIFAAKSNNSSIFRFLIWNGADIQTTSSEGNTVLHASLYRMKDPVWFLKLVAWIWKDFNVNIQNLLNQQNNAGKTVFELNWNNRWNSTSQQVLMIVHSLCKNGPRNILLLSAIKLGCSVAVLNFLVNNGATPNICNEQGKHAIQIAAENGDWHAVIFIFLLDTDLAYLDLNAKHLLYQTLQSQFYQNGNRPSQFGTFMSMLKNDIFQLMTNEKLNICGNTHFHLAAMFYDANGYYKFAKTLLNNKNFNLHDIRNKQEQTPLQLALFHVNLTVETVDLFFSSYSPDKFEKSEDTTKCSKPFLSAVETADKDGHSVVHYALLGKRDLKLVKHLVNLGADPHAIDKEGRSSVDIGEQLGLADHAQYFLELGVQAKTQESESSKSQLYEKISSLFEIYDNL